MWTAEWIAAAIAVLNVIFGLFVTVVVLKIKNSVLEALDKFRKECDDKYLTKELAEERHEAILARFDRIDRAREHGA